MHLHVQHLIAHYGYAGVFFILLVENIGIPFPATSQVQAFMPPSMFLTRLSPAAIKNSQAMALRLPLRQTITVSRLGSISLIRIGICPSGMFLAPGIFPDATSPGSRTSMIWSVWPRFRRSYTSSG